MSPVGPLFRGFMYLLASLTFNAVSIIRDDDEAVAKAEYDFALILDGLSQARCEIERVVGGARD